MRIHYDVDTQRDFMNSNGALHVPGTEEIKLNLKRLTDYAREHNVPVLGSVDRHFGKKEYEEREGELAKYGGPFPDHCMDETRGQSKIDETTLVPFTHGKGEMTENFHDHGHYVEHALSEEFLPEQALEAIRIMNLRKTYGVYFEKQNYDVFTNPVLEIVLGTAGIDEAIVYGVATDYCVKAAVLGMQERGVQTYVVTDAIKGITSEGEKGALEEMAEAGAKFVTTSDVLEGRLASGGFVR